jgi:DNA-binding response OmpR family regulator
MCILVIEDDSAIRQGILDALQFAGYETLQAADGATGQKEALRATIDLLLLDLVLPELSAWKSSKPRARHARPCRSSF